MALSIMFWVNYTSDRSKLIRKSENAVACDRVLRFTYDTELSHVSAHVQASMRDKSYRVEIQLNDLYGTDHTSCECPMGNFYCHHVAAVLLFGYKRASKTDVKCSWLKRPKSSLRSTGKTEASTMEDLFPPRRQQYRALNRDVDQEDRDQMCSNLEKLGRFTGMQWILSPEPEKEASAVSTVEDVILSQEYMDAACKRTFLARALTVSPETIQSIARITTGQRANSMWSVVRRHRLTSSNFGVILSAIRRNSYPPSLWKRLQSHYNLEKKDAIGWGVNHECKAIEEYCKLGAQIEQTGIWLHESGILGASPDGLVQTPIITPGTHPADIIEVKCPFSVREIAPLDAIGKKNFCLERRNGEVSLVQDHPYYHQIQGQLYILDKACCDLIIWTPHGLLIHRVPRDQQWAQNIPKLLDFFHMKYIPIILS